MAFSPSWQAILFFLSNILYMGFQHCAIIGLGLLGGSLAIDLRLALSGDDADRHCPA